MSRPRHPIPAGARSLGFCLLVGCAGEPPPPAAETDGTTSSMMTTTGGPPPSADSTTAPTPADVPDPGVPIVPGVGVGELMLGDRGDRLMMLAGEPDSSLRFGNAVLLTFDSLAIEVLMAAPAGEELTAAGKVLSIGALGSDEVEFSGPAVPGQDRGAIIDASGAPSESVEETDLYEAGWSVVYRSDDSAKSVTVFPPYTLAVDPPPMTPIPE